MKNIISTIFFILIISSCVNIPQKKAENVHHSSFYPFIISKGEAQFIDIKYKISGRIGRKPPHAVKIIDKYLYLVAFTLHVKEGIVWDRPFLLNIQFPYQTSETILFNDEELALTDAKPHEYFFTVEVEAIQRIKITLGYQDQNGNEIFDFDNPFHTLIVGLD